MLQFTFDEYLSAFLNAGNVGRLCRLPEQHAIMDPIPNTNTRHAAASEGSPLNASNTYAKKEICPRSSVGFDGSPLGLFEKIGAVPKSQ
jgi:hypothetical protein